MSIKNILFDLKYYENDIDIREIMIRRNCNWEEAVQFDISENYHLQNRELVRETSHITDHLTRVLNSFNTGKCRQINFCCTRSFKAIPLRDYGSIIEFDVIFDYQYFEFDDYQKHEYIYNLLYSSLDDLCNKLLWNFQPFSEALAIIRQNKYVNNFLIGKRIRNENKLYAQLYCEQTLKKMQVFSHITDNKGNLLKKVFLFESFPHVYDYARYLGKFKWDGNDKVLLESQDGQSKIEAFI